MSKSKMATDHKRQQLTALYDSKASGVLLDYWVRQMARIGELFVSTADGVQLETSERLLIVTVIDDIIGDRGLWIAFDEKGYRLEVVTRPGSEGDIPF